MRRTMLKSKIHRIRVTQADVDYEGSFTLDAELLDAADILPNEVIHVWNVTTGSRFTTYAMLGERQSGVACINGAAAHLACPGDIVIVATFADLDDVMARTFRPRVLLVDERNRVKRTTDELPGPRRR